MQSIYAHPGVHLALGRKGENVARQVVFDLRATFSPLRPSARWTPGWA